MAEHIKKTKDTTEAFIKRWLKRITAVSVSSVVLFFSFFHPTPDHKVIQNHKQISFGINQALAQGDGGDGGGDGGDGGDGDGGASGDAGDAGDGGAGAGAGGDAGDAGDGGAAGDAGDAGDGGAEGDDAAGDDGDGGAVGDAAGDADGDAAGDTGDAVGDDAGDAAGDGGGPGGIGGPGGLNPPTVSVSSTRLPGAGEQPLAFITLSQVPYTGFKAGAFLSGLYWFALMLWSAVLAYILFVHKFGAKISYALKSLFGIGRRPALQTVAYESEVPAAEHTSPEPKLPSEVMLAHDSLVLETGPDGTMPRLELKRSGVRRPAVPVSPEPAPVRSHTEVPNLPVGPAPERVIEDAPKIQTTERDTSRLGDLIKAIVHGETADLLSIMQAYKSRNQNMTEVIVQALCELDRLYCKRTGEGEGPHDESIEDSFENWDNKHIERLISMISSGIDRNYLTQHTSAKMALLRALEYAKERRSR